MERVPFLNNLGSYRIMNKIIRIKSDTIESAHKCESGDYEYYKRDVVPRGYSNNTKVSVYIIPPGKSAYPYHFHYKNEETFYILSGEGLLKTPAGDKIVSSGDFIFFPASPDGAHKLTNISDVENLTYIDFDVTHDVDVAVYPDSNKIGVWGKDINKTFYIDDSKEYYDGE